MIAYVFWHWVEGTSDRAAYEAAQRGFHERLRAATGEGFEQSHSYRVRGAPWIPGSAGYEDWYLLDGSHALDILNDLAVSPPVRGAHEAAAHGARGLGGLYRLMRGIPVDRSGTVAWLSKPAGEAYDDFYRRLPGTAVLWRRQMVLGPAPEFLCEGEAPEGLDPLRVDRELYVSS